MADVAIVGTGYTGLWTAHSLLQATPGLRVIIIEADHVGAGASGLNGGWCVGELAGGLGAAVALAERRTGSTDDGARLTREIMSTVDEIGRVAHDEGIECNFTKGGVLRLARTAPQLTRQQAEVAEHRHHGFGSNDIELLSADAATARLSATDVLGGMWYSAGARVHPARLVHGLAARETFADDRRMVIYGQRTADDRIAFGGRGAPYRFGSKIIENDSPQAIHDRITATLHQLLPATRDAAITHRWGGVLGIPRDWQRTGQASRRATLVDRMR